jgi:hypothetical protein
MKVSGRRLANFQFFYWILLFSIMEGYMQNGGLKPPEIFKFQLLLVGFNPCETSSSS